MRSTALTLAMLVGTTSALAGGKGICPDCLLFDLDAGSSATIDARFDTFLGGLDPDAVTVDVTGSVLFESSDFSDPMSLSLHELAFTLSPPAEFAGDADIDPELGSASFALSVSDVNFSGKPIENDGLPLPFELAQFQFSSVPVAITGSDSVQYDLEGVGTGSLSGLLAASNPYGARLDVFSISSDNITVTFSAALSIDPIAVFYEIGLVETFIDSFTVSFDGSAPAPPRGCNTADLTEPFGLLDLADINFFVTAFNAGDLSVDFSGNGLNDLADINIFITAFNAGCP